MAGDCKNAAYAWVPIVSPVAQKARIVFDTPADITVWLDGKPLALSGKSENKNEPRSAVVDLPEGSSALLIRVPAGGKSSAGVARDDVGGRPTGWIQRERRRCVGDVRRSSVAHAGEGWR